MSKSLYPTIKDLDSRASQSQFGTGARNVAGCSRLVNADPSQKTKLTTKTGTGFGNNTNNSTSLFGNKPASSPFGSNTNTGTGLFGNSSSNTGFGASTGGFGSNTNTSAFGSNTNTTGSGFSFGNTANKPAFGSSTPSAPLFGQGGSGTTGGFGSSTNTFGAGTALAGQTPPAPGTAVTPFNPFIEKDGTSPVSSAYQSLTFQEPYSKYSFEELRLADYNAGRQFGNNSGQAGGFGSSTFGGFGSTNASTGFGNNQGSGLFGNNNASSSGGFGSNTTTTGLGSGGLFGSKPASGGLFGSQSSGTTGGGLFGTSNNTSNTGFGGGGGGLFGNNNQNKSTPFGASTTPSFSFGANNTNTNTNTNTGGGLFGNNNTANTNNQSGGGLFGANNQTQQQGGGLFGNNNNQQKSLFGGTTTGFGSSTTQNQPSGGLFGNTNTNTGGGLFGNANNQQNTNTGGGLFGSANNSNTGTSMFGNNNANNQQKPGGLFGSSFGTNNTSNTGGGLFGNSTNNNQQAGGLFGNNNNTNSASGFSFGNSANKPATGGLFGNTTNNQQSQSGGLPSFGGLFNNSTNNQQNSQQQQDFRVSSLNDPNPYGQTSIWTGLPVPTPDNSKPIYTPLTATQKLKESQSKPPPSLRLNQSRYMTPPRRQGGFGFSYSTYGTPNSAASTPGGGSLTSSLYGNRSFNAGSLGRSFGKSASASNLRSQFNGGGDGDSVLSPNAFNASHTRWSGGNTRRLTIDRSIRTDLFSRPSLPALPSPNTAEPNTNGVAESTPANPEPTPKSSGLKKRVSFDQDTTGGTNGILNGSSGALVRVDSEDSTPEPDSRTRSSNGSATPEMQQVRGNELAVVPEDRASDHVSPKKATVEAKPDPQPGDYWMKPTRAELSRMPREKLQKFTGFQVGRKGCGYVVFDGPVDLTSVPFDDLYDKIVEIRLRSITVYPDSSSKPPMGKGLNVPSTLYIENSWPRARGHPSSATSGPVFDKHVNRLKKMANTEFINYDVTTGVWTFRVPHYTRYGLDYDDDDDLSQSQISAPPQSLSSSNSGMEVDVDAQDSYDDEDDEDDTFAFKQKNLPGQFGKSSGIDDYDDTAYSAQEMDDNSAIEINDQSDDDDAEIGGQDVHMAGSFPPPAIAASALDFDSPRRPILRANLMDTPGKPLISLDGDWAEQLQRTISPRKQNRDALRNVQSKILLDRTFVPIQPQTNATLAKKNEFRTSIDIMNSLFSRTEDPATVGRKGLQGKKGMQGQATPDFELPYAKRPKTFSPQSETSTNPANDRFADAMVNADGERSSGQPSFKPRFTAKDGLVYLGAEDDGAHVIEAEHPALWTTKALLGDVKITSLRGSGTNGVGITDATSIKALLADTNIRLVGSAPFITHLPAPFSQIRDRLIQEQSASQAELDIYELLHVLFDEYEDEFSSALSHQQKQEFEDRIRKDRISKFLSETIWRRHGEKIKSAERSKGSAATTAILYLTSRNIKAASDVLYAEKDFHLALLIAQLEGVDKRAQDMMTEQISAWREQNIISEMTEDIRSLYEIFAGNTGICEGKDKVAAEDRASTFSISEKLQLDWLQTFALVIWYGRNKSGAIEDAVAEFQERPLEEGTASPVDGNGNEDPLWVLLKLYASRVKGGRPGQGPTFPQGLSSLLEVWNSQKIFRLHHSMAGGIRGLNIDQAKAEELANTLSFEYSSRGDVVGAVYALLHLHNADARGKQVKQLLEKHAAMLPDPTEAGVQQEQNLFVLLTEGLRVPAEWLYSAKALLARSINDSEKQLEYQLRASDYAAAHETLLRRVAPALVIDEDWPRLTSTLELFGEDAESRVGAVEWSEGGGVYEIFVTLMNLDAAKGSGASSKNQQRGLVRRLTTILRQLNLKAENRGSFGTDKERLEERVALREMGRKVADVMQVEDEQAATLAEKKAMLDLPLAADAKLSHARALGVAYYRGLMAAAAS
ncbi:hypothetical protein B0A52_00112 [Exophiala mesophila]|uniref:Peptidase S59 domain-containing protein n=1 Tax=Exophiala mesophila TaxID=212818 RepID=A0A438NJ38_EXOME|nr:hypothetical protein B0A52_00112 [Exophiala mesophila]